MKRNDPAKVFTCVMCKRVRPKNQRESRWNKCRNRDECRAATADWLSRESFAVGVTRPWGS